MGYMSELPKFPKYLKGWELLDIYGRMYGMTEQERKEQVPKLLGMVGLKGRERDFIGKYSKGMQQRLGIAQALLNGPELVVLDEPSLGLDPVGMVEVRELVKGIAKEGVTVFISSHLLFEVEQICSHVTIIHRGVSLVSDTLQNVSSKFSGPTVLLAEVAKLSDVTIQKVKELPFVSNVSKDGNTLIIELKTRDDVRSQVSQEITNSGGVIVSMSLKGPTLEEVFMQLVTKSNGGKAE
jgi:ABC-2 type transport system ATP-binding protein